MENKKKTLRERIKASSNPILDLADYIEQVASKAKITLSHPKEEKLIHPEEAKKKSE